MFISLYVGWGVGCTVHVCIIFQRQLYIRKNCRCFTSMMHNVQFAVFKFFAWILHVCVFNTLFLLHILYAASI